MQSEEPVSFRKFDERTVEITKYEMFYRDTAFYSKEEVEYYSLNDTISSYALFHHLEKHGYKWDDETRAQKREWIQWELDYDQQDSVVNAYYEKMFETLQITEEEYIDYYLLVNKEYERLQHELYDKKIGLNKDGVYEDLDAKLAYMKLVGISPKYLNDLFRKIPEPIEPLEPQPALPFSQEDSYLEVATNSEGEYVFVITRRLDMYMGDAHRELLYEIRRDDVSEWLTRNNLNHYQKAVSSYKSDDPKKNRNSKRTRGDFRYS